MSTFHPQQAKGGVPPRPVAARPAVLTAAMAAVAVTGLITVVAGVMVLASGKEAIAEYLGVESTGLAFASVVDEAFSLMQARAIVFIVLGALALLGALLIRKGGVGARVYTTVVLLAVAGYGLFNWTDLEPFSLHVMPMVSALVAVVALIMVWLPGIGRYAKATKNRH